MSRFHHNSTDASSSGVSPPSGDRRLVLTPTDVELLRWLWMLRVLTLGQLRRIGYYQPNTGRLSALDNVRKRLRRLEGKGYLVDDLLIETRERLYFLGERALEPLREHCGIEQRRLYKPRGLDTMRQLQHSLLVAECAVRFLESVRGSSLQLPNLPPLQLPFYHTHAVGDPSKKKHVERFVSQEDIRVPGQPKANRIRPDLVFALAQDDVSRLYFLEADRGSESPKQIAEKQLAYHYYQQTPDPLSPRRYLWQRYGEMGDFRVLLVTTHQRRVEILQRHLAQQKGWNLMALTTEEAVKKENAVFGPIWTNQQGVGQALAAQA